LKIKSFTAKSNIQEWVGSYPKRHDFFKKSLG
jgi:hypothetical protein